MWHAEPFSLEIIVGELGDVTDKVKIIGVLLHRAACCGCFLPAVRHLSASPALAQMRCAARTCASSPSCGTAWPRCCASWRTTPAAQLSLSFCDQVRGAPPQALSPWHLQWHLTASAIDLRLLQTLQIHGSPPSALTLWQLQPG